MKLHTIVIEIFAHDRSGHIPVSFLTVVLLRIQNHISIPDTDTYISMLHNNLTF